MVITATYSPEDDKLRLSASTRLDPDTYARVDAAGFRWAPKQGVFYAVWTPGREDLALELAGEVEDEDSTLIDRAEDRADRFEGYRDRRMQDAEHAKEAVAAIADHIPLGQPILVGHHSERRARRDAERIENGMRRAVQLWRTSEYWQQRAQAAIRHAKYKERPDVRARRIKGLEAEQRKVQRERSQAERFLQLWDGLESLKRKDGAETSIEERARFVANICPLTVAPPHWSAWDVLRPEDERYANCPSMTVPEIQEIARRVYPERMAHCDRWLEHLVNRLEYERAMLDKSGYQEPPKKKNKAELPILNYPGTISYRNPYQPGESVTGEAVGLTKAQWSAINTDYKGTRVAACGTHRVRTTMMAPGHRHQLVAIYLTDSKIHPRPTEETIAAKTAEEERENERRAEALVRRRLALRRASEDAQATADPARDSFRDLAGSLQEGVQVVRAPQLFPTPGEVAARMVELLEVSPGHRVLEPSAGTGNLIRAVFDAAPVHIVGVEINQALAHGIRGDWLQVGQRSRIEIRCADFLTCNGDLDTFDRIIMNPPFENGADIKHILHARTMLKPGGVLVALCANGPRQRETLKPLADSWEDLRAGSFRASGTSVNVALLVIRSTTLF